MVSLLSKDVIHQMKDALAQQANELTGSASPDRSSNSTNDAVALTAELRESQKQCVLLEAKLVTLEAQQQASGATPGSSDAKVLDALSSVSAQLAACNAELNEANRTIETQAKRIAELEAQLEALGASGEKGDNTAGGRGLASDRVRPDAQVAELKRKLASASSDIERLVRERSQLMELSNQLRADLRKVRERHNSGSSLDDAAQATAFAGKKDFENLVAELSRSLEEARVHNKTLKKELRRMLKQQQILASGGPSSGDSSSAVPPPPPPSSLASLSRQRDDQELDEAESRAYRREARRRTASVASSAAGTDVTSSEGRRRSSTLSMMKALDEPSNTPSRTQRSGGDFDAELLSLVRSKRPSDAESAASPFQRERRRSSSRSSVVTADTVATPQRHRSASSASRPPSIRERDNEDDDNDESDDDGTTSTRRRTRTSSASSDARSGPKTALSSLFQRDRLDSIASAEDATTTAKVSDARLRLQQDILSTLCS